MPSSHSNSGMTFVHRRQCISNCKVRLLLTNLNRLVICCNVSWFGSTDGWEKANLPTRVTVLTSSTETQRRYRTHLGFRNSMHTPSEYTFVVGNNRYVAQTRLVVTGLSSASRNLLLDILGLLCGGQQRGGGGITITHALIRHHRPLIPLMPNRSDRAGCRRPMLRFTTVMHCYAKPPIGHHQCNPYHSRMRKLRSPGPSHHHWATPQLAAGYDGKSSGSYCRTV